MPFNSNTSGVSGRPEQNELVLKELFRLNYKALVYFAFKITGDRPGAEDIVQDAFVKYWNHRDEVSPDIPAIKSYLYTAVRNAGLNWLRHQHIVRNYEKDLCPEPLEDNQIVQMILESEVAAAIHQAIDALPPVCRKIMKLGHLEGMKNEEIAQELGISVNSVKTQKQRGLQLLRQKLSPELFLSLLLLPAP